MHPIELMCEQADAFIQAGHHKSGAPVGCNGPHKDPETTYRNSAHWLALLSRLFCLTGQKSYENGAHDLADFLMADPRLADGILPIMRKKEGKDAANGVIGAAWLIEGLTIGATCLQRADLSKAAAALGRYFPFDTTQNLWVVREPDGSLTQIDTTLNHQIWFAMACSLQAEIPPELKNELQLFIQGLRRHLRHTDKNLIAHTVKSPFLSKAWLIEAASPIFSKNGPYPQTGLFQNKFTRKLSAIHTLHNQKETGYLAFTLLALARISTSPVGKSLDSNFCIKSYAKLKEIAGERSFDENIWSFPYNPPGFEFPHLAEQLGDKKDICTIGRHLYQRQLEKTYDKQKRSFTKGNSDPATMTARLYTLALCRAETLDLLDGDN